IRDRRDRAPRPEVRGWRGGAPAAARPRGPGCVRGVRLPGGGGVGGRGAPPGFAALLTGAKASHPGAVALLHERARLVASAAAMLVDVLNPELLVVAGAGAGAL